ncbi:hypothetical protein H5410_039001 [Solanum commersonii]|uniref:Protein kinase domain-containing protein n=1 Tax=Solanum commersonii TaxID=4109 RepID=A0A9J5YBS1_SOLCO|nr:hypothetical protein H5410_039001 [Solanum commersonii]
MEKESSGLIIGISIGVVIGVLLAIAAFFCFRRYHRRRPQIGNSSSRRAATVPIRANGVDTCTVLSDSSIGTESPKSIQNGMPFWLGSVRKSNVVSASGILEYSYKDLQRATYNFTTLIGQGAYGPVYKAQMSTGETVAVKVLATDSKQGEKEFQTEVMLLGRLHHRNLVNLVGYCAEKGQHMLIYVYMSRGSLASHLYDEKLEPLRWELRVQIALDVARGLEYLHDGAVPPVVHRDIKSSNILLDQSMRARVADFGLSREEMVSKHVSNIRGTFGYLDPEYISTRSFTKKSDVYSFGVLLFELIAGKNPLQGLIEYIELAAMTTDGKGGWEEIADSRLDGKYDLQELNDVAALAYKCVNRAPKKRPSMRDTVQVLSRILKSRHERKRQKRSLSATAEEITINVEQLDHRSPISGHRRVESIDSTADSYEYSPIAEKGLYNWAVLDPLKVQLSWIGCLDREEEEGSGFYYPIQKLSSVLFLPSQKDFAEGFEQWRLYRAPLLVSPSPPPPSSANASLLLSPFLWLNQQKVHLKRWERKECKPNSLPVLHKMHVRLGDTVKVISGHDKGKIGEITEIIKHNSKVVVKEVNLKTKHVKSRSEEEPGQIVKIEAPIHSSNVMLYSKEQKVTSRVGHKTLDNGKRVRYLIKTGEIIDSADNWKKAVKEKGKTTEAVAAAS